MRKIFIFLLFILSFFVLSSIEKDRLAVMDVTDETGMLDEKTIITVTDYIFTRFQGTGSFWMIPKSDRDTALDKAIEETKISSRKECVDEKCQLSLVAELQANFLINTKIKKLYEGTCNITISKFDVEKRAGVFSWMADFNCSKKGLFDIINNLNFGMTIVTSLGLLSIPDDYEGIVVFLDNLLNSTSNDTVKIDGIKSMFLKEYFRVNGIGLIMNKLDGFPILAEKLFSATEAECEKGQMMFCAITGRYFYRLKNYNKAKEFFEKGCNNKYSFGCGSLGFMFDKGEGVIKNEQKAIELFKKACDGGDLLGCFSLAFMYYRSKVEPQNMKKAFKLYEKACNGGNLAGCGGLGAMYDNGDFVPKDKRKAIELYKKACYGGLEEVCKYINN